MERWVAVRMGRVASGWAAYADEIGIAAHGRTEAEARKNLERSLKTYWRLLKKRHEPVTA